MRAFAAITCLLVVGACDEANSDTESGDRERIEQRRAERSTIEQIGRFIYYPPSGEMPAVLLDTATGCVEFFKKVTSVENPRDVKWWREYGDTVVPLVRYDGDNVAEVPNSAPPQRCNLSDDQTARLSAEPEEAQ